MKNVLNPSCQDIPIKEFKNQSFSYIFHELSISKHDKIIEDIVHSYTSWLKKNNKQIENIWKLITN